MDRRDRVEVDGPGLQARFKTDRGIGLDPRVLVVLIVDDDLVVRDRDHGVPLELCHVHADLVVPLSSSPSAFPAAMCDYLL